MDHVWPTEAATPTGKEQDARGEVPTGPDWS
jgi:hypothetical protein